MREAVSCALLRLFVDSLIRLFVDSLIRLFA